MSDDEPITDVVALGAVAGGWIVYTGALTLGDVGIAFSALIFLVLGLSVYDRFNNTNGDTIREADEQQKTLEEVSEQ